MEGLYRGLHFSVAIFESKTAHRTGTSTACWRGETRSGFLSAVRGTKSYHNDLCSRFQTTSLLHQMADSLIAAMGHQMACLHGLSHPIDQMTATSYDSHLAQ